MNTFTDSLFNVVSHLSERLGPVTSLIDGIVDRIAPKLAASACTNVYLCGHTCGTCCANCSGDAKYNTTLHWAANAAGCATSNCYSMDCSNLYC